MTASCLNVSGTSITGIELKLLSKALNMKLCKSDMWRQEISMFSDFCWLDDGWWLLSVFFFHAGVFLALLSSRNQPQTLIALGSCIILVIACSDAINYVIIESQEMFASRTYFDTTGTFTGMIVTIPFMLHALAISAILIVRLISDLSRFFL